MNPKTRKFQTLANKIWRWPFGNDFSAAQTIKKYHTPPSRNLLGRNVRRQYHLPKVFALSLALLSTSGLISSCKNGSNSHFNSSLHCLCCSAQMGMESFELGLVSAEEGREVPETTRFCRQALQAFVWRLERKFRYVEGSKEQTHWFIRRSSTSRHALPPSTGQGLWYSIRNPLLSLS